MKISVFGSMRLNFNMLKIIKVRSINCSKIKSLTSRCLLFLINLKHMVINIRKKMISSSETVEECQIVKIPKTM